MAARREKGLCYNCEEKYFTGHRCKHKVLYMVMTEEEEPLYSQEVLDCSSLPITVKDNTDMEEVQLSLHSMMAGLTTLRVVGEVGNQQLNILLDIGSTLSFLQEDTTTKLGCIIHHDRPLLVRVANGQKLVSTRRAADFKWVIQGHELQYSPRLLRNKGCDMILGGDWLRFCTPIELDYDTMSITVTLKGERVRL